MKKITMFIQPQCPHCIKALKLIDEVRAKAPELEAVEIEIHDELKEAAFADTFDYYYVPTFYVGDHKAHEGSVNEAAVEGVLRSAIE